MAVLAPVISWTGHKAKRTLIQQLRIGVGFVCFQVSAEKSTKLCVTLVYIGQADYVPVVETFDYVVPQRMRGGVVRLNLGRGSDPAKWEEAGWVEFMVDPDAVRSGEVTIREVRISLPGPMTPSRL